MKAVTFQDILSLEDYEAQREERRKKIIQLKSRRRISLGGEISLVFENRETVINQIHEMLRAEKITDREALAHELETYNQLLPRPSALAATLFIELQDPNNIRRELERFLGLDGGEHLWIDLGSDRRVLAVFEAGHSEEGRISSVQYVQFPFGDEERALFLEPAREIAAVIDHPGLRARRVIDPETREELGRDFVDP